MNLSHLYVFDLDKTLLKTNGSFRFYFFLYAMRFFPLHSLFHAIRYYLSHRFFNLSLHDLHHKVFRVFLQGKSYSLIEKHAKTFVDKHLEKMLHPVTSLYLEEVKKKGGYTLILSSSPSFLVGPIAEKLLVDEWKGTEYHFNGRGEFEEIGSLMQGKEKAKHTLEAAQKLNIDPKHITVLTDSITDLPLAKIAGEVIAVSPDAALRKRCKEQGWHIL